MLKNKIIVKKIRNIFILLMAILIMVGIYHNIRNSRAENVIQIEMEVSDRSNVLSAQTITADATETSDGKYILDLPTSVNGNIVTRYYTAEGEEILSDAEKDAEENNVEGSNTTESNVSDEDNTVTIQLTEAEVAEKKIQLQTDYDTKEVTVDGETKVLYNKELQNTPNEDGTENKDVTVTGYMPLNAQLEVNEIDLAKLLKKVEIPNESQTMQKAYEVSIFEMVEQQITNTEPEGAENVITEVTTEDESTEAILENESEEIISENVETERVEYDPSVYGEKITIKTKYAQTDAIITIYNLAEDNQVTEMESTADDENVEFEGDKTDKTIRYIIATEPKPETTSGTEENADSMANEETKAVAPNDIENSEWKVIESKPNVPQGKATVKVKGPDDRLTEDWVNVIINGESLEEGITKTISEKEVLSDGVQYTITITGIPADTYQIKIGLVEPKTSGIQMFSMADDDIEATTANDSGIMLLATTYNTLKSSSGENSSTKGFLGNTDIQRQYIESVTFKNSTSGAASNKWDVSSAGDSSIIAWYTGSGPYQVYIGSSSTIYANEDSGYLFSHIGFGDTCTATSVINGLELLNTSNVTNMSCMFSSCGYTAMTSLDLGNNFDTSSVTNMSYMFANCGDQAMTSLDLGDKFDTSSVTKMSNMFSSCGYKAMTSLDLGDKFDTSSVTNMVYMFERCGYTAMTSLDLGNNFDTNSVTSMSNMFYQCGYNAMTSLDLSSGTDATNTTQFKTSSVTDMDYMFCECGYKAMTSLDLGNNFDTNSVTSMTSMFYYCGYKAMTSLELGDKFDTSNVTSMVSMFGYCGYTAMTSLDLGDKFDTSNVTDMSWMFFYCGYKAMTSLDLGNNFDTSKVKDMNDMFYSCGYTAMTSLSLGDKFNTSSVTNMDSMFSSCGYTKMTSLSLGDKFNTSSVTNMSSMFSSCGYTKMTSLSLGSLFDTSSVTNMNSMFDYCGYKAMTSLDLGDKFNTSNVTNMSFMFNKCGYTAMTTLNLGNNFDTSSVTNMKAMFQMCGYTAMTSLNLRNKFDTSNVTDMSWMFNKCGYTAMTTLNLGNNFDTSSVTNMRAMFQRCGYTVMTSLDLGDKFDTSSVTNMSQMFYECGYTAMTTLEMGPAFKQIPDGDITDGDDTYKAYDYFASYLGKSGCIVYCTEDIYSSVHAFKLNSTSTTTIAYDRGEINPTSTGHKDNSGTTTSGGTLCSAAGETAKDRGFLGNTSIQRQYIESVTFKNSTSEANSTKWDVSEAQDGSILAWYTGSSPYQVYIGSDGDIYANADSSYLFSYIGNHSTCTATSVINGLELLNTSNVTNMSYMFRNCGYTAMTSFDLGDQFDTSKVTNMEGMFFACGSEAMTSFSLGSNFDTSSVTNMYEMFTYCGNDAMTSFDVGNKFDTKNVTNMEGMFRQWGHTKMTSLDLGDKFDTSKVTNMRHMFAQCGYKAMTSLDLGSNFNTSNVTNMSYMFLSCGYKAMTSLDLGSNFNTSNVTDMGNMFQHCGHTAMTSLYLGDKFDTSKVTDMGYMFQFCGYTAMTTLELGPAFKNIANSSPSANTSFATDLGKSGCIIFCREEIYSSLHAFKLNSTSTTTIAYDRGYINPTSDGHKERTKPTWASNISEGTYSSSDKTYTLNLVGSDETGLNVDTSKLSTSNVTVKVGSTTVSSSNLTFGTTTTSDDNKTITFPLTIKNYTGDSISISISAGALVDTSGNKSVAKTYSIAAQDTTAPTWADSVSGGTWSTSGKTYALTLVGTDNLELNNSSSTLSSSKVTVKVGGTKVNSWYLTFGSATLTDSKTKKFPLTIKNYTGGKIEITINAGALVDAAGNTSEAKTYTIVTDSTSPTWSSDVSNKSYSASAKTYSLDLVGTDDKYLNDSSSSLSGKLTVKVNNSATTNYTLGTTSLNSSATQKTFPLTINNYTGGSISISISAGALVDTGGNTSAAKTYSFTPDTTSPVWNDDIDSGTYSISSQKYQFNVIGSDETSLDTSSSKLTKGSNIAITVDGTATTNYTIGTATTSGNTKTFPITLTSFTGGTVKVTISAGALKDTAGNESEQKEYEFWVDGEKPVWADNIIDGTYDADAKTYSLKFQGTDNDALTDTTLTGTGTGKNVTITATDVQGNVSTLTDLSFGSVTTSSDNKIKTYPLTINNFPGGDIKIVISSGALKDTTGNTSDEKTYEFSVDGVSPIWADDISNGTYSSTANTYSFELKGSDDVGINNTSSVLSSSNVTITVDGENANFTFGNATLNDKIKTFPITINDFYGGNVVVQINANALVDTSGNKSEAKQYLFYIDATSPVWADDVSDGTYNSSTKKYSLNLTGSDETALDDSASVLNTSNMTVTVDGAETTDWTIGATTLTDGKTKTFPLTLNNFTGGTVKININAGALKDTSNNSSAPKEYSFVADVTPPEWNDATGEYNPDDQSYTITITGTDNAKLNNVLSELTTSNINLTVGGTTVTPTITTTATTTTSETYTLTWSNHSGGEVLLKINEGALVDTTGNTSAYKEYTFSGVDATKPVWNASISDATYTLANDTDNFGTFTFNIIGSDNVALNDAQSLLDGKLTITTDGTLVKTSDLTIGTPTLSSDGKTKTFPITVTNFKGGDVVITISSGALIDTTGNKSNSISYTFFRDVTRPVWNENISEAIYDPTTSEYSFELVGSDEYELNTTNSVLETTDPANITITFGEGTNITTPSFTLGTPTVSGNTKKFPVTVDFSDYNIGEKVNITINKSALVDTTGNVSLEKTYTFTPDIEVPVWTHENLVYNPDDVSYSVELVGTDEELDTTLSALVTSGSGKNVTVTCGSTTVTPTLTNISTSSTEIRYKLTINDYPGGVVTINIDAGALIDVAKNQSIETTITLEEKDIVKPTLIAQNPEYSSADKTYTFDIVASDNVGIDNTTSALATSGSGKNVTITCGGGDIQSPTISIKNISTTQIIYQVTIPNYPAGIVNVSIDAAAIKDTTGNKSIGTNFTLPALDIANPYWEEQKPAVEYDENAKTVNLSLVGKDETSLNDSESTLTLGSNIIIYADGQPISSSKVVFGTPTISSDQLTKTFPLTINNFTGGILEISIGSGALKDNSGKVSDAKTYTFSDIIKPKWTIEPKGTYDRDNNIYTVTLHAIDDISLATADLASNLTVLVDGDGDGTGTAVTPTVTLTSDGETQKTYTVAIPNYLGGQIELLIAEGALTDDEGNRSKETYFACTPDITAPIWEVGNVAFESETENTDIIIIDLYGSDETMLADSSLVKNNITVQFGDVIIDRADIELTGPESSEDEKGGVIYQLRISGYTGEDITLIISPDTLTDDSGNKSVRTTITSEAIIPDSDNDVPTVSNVSHAVDAINGVVTVDFDIRDSWYNFKDLIEAGEYTISAKNYSSSGTMWGSGSYSSVDVSSATITVVKQIRLAKGYHYRIKIEGLSSILRTGTAWEQSGWQWTQVTKYPLLTVTLNANAATDLFNKGNVVTNLLQDQEIDFTVSDGAASLSLKAVSLNKSLKAMYIDLHATWTSSGNIWGSGSSGNTDFTLTSDMITGLTIDGESIIDFIKEEGKDRLQITNGTTSSSSSSTGGWWGSSTTIYNKDIRITLLDFVEDTRQSGKEYLEWSGNVGLTLSSGSTNYLFEEETYATENADNVLFADLINPEIEVVSSTINDEDINSVTVRVKATDKYFVPNAVFNTDKVKVTLDGEYPTEEQNISISFGTEDELFGMRNGVSEQYGIVQDITITGLADKLDQRIQLRLETGAIADLSGNVNATKKITLFNFLKDTSTETTATSAFLGITDTSGNAIPRQNIESVQFLNTTASAPSQVPSVTDGVFDVSAEQDGSILAWYTGSGPYQVYIASNNPIYANPNSSYLFSYIGSGTSCTNTSIFSNLNLLNTRFTTNMSYMFNNCGSAKMTSLDLGAFDTSRAENMTGMFQSCGNTAMTSLNLGTAFKLDKVTDMSNMFNGCGSTAMTTLTLGDNFDTTNVQNMSGMFQNCGKTAMTSLDLGEKFYTTSATNMSNMFNGCGNTAMTSLDLGPAFTRIASTNTGFATNCGKSGTVKIYVGSSIYSSKSAFKLDADSSTTISYTTGTIIPKYKPEWTKTYATYDADNQKLTVRLEGKVNATNYTNAIQTVTNNFSNGVLTEDPVFANQIIKVRIDGEEASTIQKELSMVVKGPADTVTCEIILTNFVQTSMQTGKSYFEWAGNVALQIAEEMLVDSYGNRSLEQSDEETGTMQRIEVKDDATTDHMIDTMMFADFVKPVITYEYSTSDINKTEKTATIVFNVTDKYYASENISLDNLTILMDGTNLKQTPVNIGLAEEDITEGGKTVGRKYTITLSELQQDIIATGKSYLDFSGPVTIAVPGGAVADKSGNTNVAKTITVGVDEKTYTDNTDESSAVVVDVVDPIWTNVENGVNLDFANNRATVKVKATDKYFDKDNCTLSNSNIKFYLDGVETTTGITISVGSPTLIQETRMVNGVSTSVDIGAEYTITITGITLNYDQAKLKIVAGTITDLNGNTSAENEVILYNRLKSADTETTAESGFLGNTSIQRQDIQKVEFVSGIAGSQDDGVQQVWDVSAVGDGSIKAWTKQTSAPYTVYIGSEGGILANRNSSYLFAHIGYGSSCTETEVITNLNLLDTSSVTNMTAMFKNCGYQKMTSLDLGSNFYTSNVTDMSSMFEGCGYNAMTTFSFGSSFDTTNVQNMSGMFQNFGQKIESLDLTATGVTFNTAQVTNMSNMFKNCGYEAMTSLNLGSEFNTSAVTNMNSMFKECGASKLTNLELGGLFYTTNVTDMTSMLNGCGQASMTTLDLGPAFTKIASTNTDFATNCGKSDEITIYTGSAIYSNENAFRLGTDSDATISFTRGTINAKYKTEWAIDSFEISDESLVITLKGNVIATDYGTYTKTVTNKFTDGETALVEVSVDGDSSANDTITKTISGVSLTSSETVTCTLTLTNFQESVRQSGKTFTEWAGDVTLKYLSISLIDSYGNPNLDQSDDTAMFVDFVKPEFTYEYYDTEINTNTSIVTIYFSITDKNFASIDTTKLTADNITVKVDNDESTDSAITKTLTKVEDVLYGTDNKKVGEKYQLVIEGLDKGNGITYSGPMTLAFLDGVAKDNGPSGDGTNPNVSSATTITIGIDDPSTGDGHDSSVIVDVVDPIWKVENLTATTADLIATDKYLSTYPTAVELKNQMQVKIGETDVTDQITIAGPTAVENGQKYTLTIPVAVADGQAESYEEFLEARRKYENGEDGGRLYREATSGAVKVVIPEGVITDTSGNTNIAKEFNMGNANDALDPEIVKVSSKKYAIGETGNPIPEKATETITFDVTDKYFAQMNYSTIELKDKIHVFVDEEETTTVSKDLQLVETLTAIVDGSTQTIGKRYTLVLSNFETPVDGKGLENGYNFKGLSGTVSIEIDEGIATDQSGNTSGGRKDDGTNTSEGQPMVGDFIDFIKPDIVYRHSATNRVVNENGETEVQIVFDVTDKYYSSGTLTADDLTIMIQDGTDDTNYINLKTIPGVEIGLSAVDKVEAGPFNKTVSGSVQSVTNQVIGQTYTLTIKNLEQAEIATGRNYLDYSGNVTIGIAADKISDTSGNQNAAKSITMGIDLPEETGSKEVLDIVRPVWTLESQTVDIDKQEATITIRGTDKYFSGSSLTANNIELYIDGESVLTNGTSKRKVSIETTTPIYEDWTIDGETSQVQIGVTYVIKITGFEVNAEQAKIRIPEGTLTDTSGNTSAKLDLVLYSCLMSATGETQATSGNDETRIFLENPYNLQRQNIESITFVSSLSGMNTSTAWDVSAVQDESIMAWYTGSGPYQVYIGSNGGIFANPDSSYLFSYIGYASNSTATSTIVNLNLLNTDRVANMSYMFAYCGTQKMTSLNLGNDFETSNVTNMSHMFEGCGQTAMTTLTIGDNFNTSSVQDMSYMFSNCGYTKMTTLDLSASADATSTQEALKFDTSSVINMEGMFANCGYTEMTTLNLGNNFNTENVQNMSAMFQGCGEISTTFTSLDLGDLFNTKSVTNMSNMFNGCGQTAMIALDLGPAFTKVASNNTNFMTNSGASGAVIYAPEAIYKTRTSFKLSSGDTETEGEAIACSNGITINPIYKPEWTKVSSTLDTTTDPENPRINVVIKGSASKLETINGVNINYNSEVISLLAQDDITIYMDGEETTNIAKLVSLESASETGSEVLYKITLSGFEEEFRQSGKNFKEWSGNIAMKIGGRGEATSTYTANILTDDTYGNQNMMAIDETGSWIDVTIKDSNIDRNTNGKMFADFIKPEFTYEYSNTTIDHETKTVTVVFDITDKYYNTSSLAANDITVTVDGKIVPSEKTTVTEDGTTETIETKTLQKKTLEADEIVGNITYKANGDIYYTVNGTSTKIGERYQLVITDLDQGDGGDYSGVMTLAFPESVVKDKSGNGNPGKTITIGVDDPTTGDGHDSEVVVDVVDPIWKVENINIDDTNKKVTADLIATDKYLTGVSNSTLTTDDITVSVDGDANANTAITKTLSDPTFSTNSDTGLKEIKYTLTLDNFEEDTRQTGKSFLEYSGTVKITIAEGTIRDDTTGVSGLISDGQSNSSKEQELELCHVDFIKPRIEKESSTKDATEKTETIIINVMDKYIDTSDALEASEITVYIDEEEATGITTTFDKNTRTTATTVGAVTYETNGDITATVNGETQVVGQQYKLVLSGFEQASKNSNGYKDWSGTVSIDVAEGAVKDTSENTNDAMTGATAFVGDYVDYITPYLTYEYLTTDIDRTGTDADGKSFQMVFDVTDKYYESGKLTIDDLTIQMTDGKHTFNLKETPVKITLNSDEAITASNIKMTNESTGEVETVASATIGHRYVLTISNLEQLEITEGNTTLDYSGIVTVAVKEDKVSDRTGNKNIAKTITSGVSIPDETGDKVVVDVVQPIWRKTTDGSIDLTNQTATLVVKGTDTYYASNSLTKSGIKVYAYTGTTPTDITSSVELTLSSATKLNESVTVDGTTSTRQYGVQYTISLTGFPIDKDQVKVVIPAGTLTDNSGNTSAAYEMIVYTTLKSAASETSSTSTFLGNSSLQRQNIESVTFVNGTADANDTKWDVSTLQDNSIIAWYTGSEPYQVYIGSDEIMCANQDSSYLFSYIGYDSTCTETSVVNGLEQLNIIATTNMSHMFQYCGYQKMTVLNLGSNFNTSNVTNMSGMFKGCGQTEMITFSFGDNFNTTRVINMSEMFQNFAHKLVSLNLGTQFYTSAVTDMSNMFNGCGQAEMTSLTLGNNFNTSQVTNMSGMFQNLGQTKMASLDLGDVFYTTNVTDMSNMFNGCGQTAMKVLDLGPAFTKIPDSHTDFMTNCGTSEIVIYAPEAIYSDKTSFKMNKADQ